MPKEPYPENRQIEAAMQAVVQSMGSGVDETVGASLNTEAQQILKMHLAALRESQFETTKQVVCTKCGEHTPVTLLDAATLTKSYGQLMKAIDVNARLMAFTAGKPDGRVEVVGGGGGGTEWLKALTTEQLQQVMQWVAENTAPKQVVEVVGYGVSTESR